MSRKLLIMAYRLGVHDSRFIKLLNSFKNAGWSVRAVTPQSETAAHPAVSLVGAVTPPSKFKVVNFMRAGRLRKSLENFATEFSPDIIYVIDPEALPAALRVKTAIGAKLVYDAHEFHEEEDPDSILRGQWVKKIELAAAPHIDSFLTVNQSIGSLYEQRRPKIPKALIVHNVTQKRLDSQSYDGRLHRKCNIELNMKICLYQGNMSPMRGLETLVSAAEKLNPNWHTVFMGSGPLKSLLEEKADLRRVSFIEPVPNQELALWTQGASLGTILYEDQGLNQHFCSPNKLWEYPAASVPVIASDLPEIRRHISNGYGWLVSSQASSDEICRVINGISDSDLQERRKKAVEFSRKNYWADEVSPLLQAMDALLAK